MVLVQEGREGGRGREGMKLQQKILEFPMVIAHCPDKVLLIRFQPVFQHCILQRKNHSFRKFSKIFPIYYIVPYSHKLTLWIISLAITII